MIKILLCTIALAGCAASTGSSAAQQQDMAPPRLLDLTDAPDLAESTPDDMSLPAQDDGGSAYAICIDSSTACVSNVAGMSSWLCRLGNDCFPPCVVPGAGLVYLDASDPDAIPLNDRINYVLPCWVPRCATYGGMCPQ